MSDIVANKGSISGEVSSVGEVSGGTVTKGKSLSAGEVARNTNSNRDYQNLDNKPTINGTELFDNYDEIDPTVPEWAKQETKPTYTYDEVGAVGAENEIHINEIDRMFATVFGE